MCDGGARLGQELFACRRQANTLRYALKQRPAEFVFKALDVLRERGLSHEKSLSRAGEGTFLGDRHKVTKL
jgi:hypothetical protein